MIIRLENIGNDPLGVGFLIKKLGGLVRQAFGKLSERLGNVAGPGNRNGKALLDGHTGLVDALYFVDLPKNFAGIAQKFLALGRDVHALGRPAKNGDAQRIFKVLNGAAQVWLVHIQGFRRFVDRPAAGDLHRIFQVQNVHADSASLSFVKIRMFSSLIITR